MSDPKDVIAFYLRLIKKASYPVEKRIINDDLFLYYHRLTDAECEAVRSQMQSLLDKLKTETEEKIRS